VNRLSPQLRQAAVTLTELLVVLVIISTLSTIALPVYVNQAERARMSVAQLEVKELANAQETCGIMHGLYVPLYILDNLPGNRGLGQDSTADTIGDASGINLFDFSVPANRLVADGNLPISSSTNSKVFNLVSNWEGPFINFQRFYDSNTDPFDLNQNDFPLDPWGNPYRFYSPVGIVGTTAIRETYSASDFNSITSADDNFDTWAVVSYGPNGESDTVLGIGSTGIRDDVYFRFGSARAETTFTSNNNPNPTPVPIP
jgi:prepilin-type N-terminal cleavage/methylation domain-containing protein